MRRIAALVAIAVLGFATYWTLRLALAGRFARTKSLQGLTRAVDLAPGAAYYFIMLAEYQEAEGIDPDRALTVAADLNPLDSSIKVRQGMRAEFRNDFAAAEKLLLEAAAVDKLFDPRAALANYYFRRNNAEAFWHWTPEALAIGYGDLTTMFRLCWRMTGDADIIRTRALPQDRQVIGKYLRFLLNENRLQAAEPIAIQLAKVAELEDVPAILDLIDRRPVVSAWNSLCTRKLIPFSPLVPDRLTNANFTVPPTSRGFDWRIPAVEGISAVRAGDSLRIDLSGKQPERCELLLQTIVLSSGKNCRFRFNRQTSTAVSGFQWRLVDPTTAENLFPPHTELNSGEEKQEEIKFSTRNPKSEIRNPFSLVLGYSRAPGTARLEGWIALRNMELGCVD